MAKKSGPKPNGKVQLPLFDQKTIAPLAELERAKESALKCTRCELHETRTHVVFGEGKTDQPDLLFLGEAPGKNEDLSGRPFVGKAGHLLDKMLQAIGYARSEVYICNVVCCRPPENRLPKPFEIQQCQDYLVRQIRVVRPKVIVLLGRTAAEALLGKTFKTIESIRGIWYAWDDIPARVTYHPAYLLRGADVTKKANAHDDLKAVRAKVNQIRERAR